MCGIIGIFSDISKNVKNQREIVQKMTNALAHRGPDDYGIWKNPAGNLTLGHCRLAIIDLSSEGHQPMISNDGRYAVVFNGEIYNYPELMEELKILGARFRGHSDTEVFLEGISRWGVDKTLDKLIGMFAFALWDNHDKKLFLARDRVGKKPLYYVKNRESIYFASELKAFKVIDSLDLSIDDDSLYQYLTFGYVPAPQSIYKNVFKVPAAHYMIVDEKLDIQMHQYWGLAWEQKKELTFREAVEEADYLLKEAVKIRLRADVSVGCFLSGGIDSGLLTSLASMQLNKTLQTFTISFKEGSFDESPLANLVAERYSTEHRVINLSPDLRELLPKVIQAYDEPFADPSAIPSYCVSKEARKYVKVVLNGEGGDELFGGYRRHLAIKSYQRFKFVFGLAPRSFLSLLNQPCLQPKTFRSKYAFIHRFIRGLVQDPYERYMAWSVDGFDEMEKKSLYKSQRDERVSSVQLLSDRFKSFNHLHPVDHFMLIDLLFNMHNDMLVKMDIATMAHGLEGRNPFLDHRMIEWVTSLPSGIRMNGFKTKPILRELSKRYLPDEIVNAPKRGFEIPLIAWLRNDLFEIVCDACLSSNGIVTHYFNRQYVEDLIYEKQNLDPDRWSKRVWILFVLALWEIEHR